MPASVTHAYFASDVYDILPEEIKNRLSVSRVRMFGQSTDSFIFYHLFSIKRGKNIRNLQRIFHTTNSQLFFLTLLSYIRENHLDQDIDTCSFLCGFICHYVLDATVHPYVFYKTGKFNKHQPDTYKYNNLHLLMETYLDNYLILKREKKNPYSFPICDFCFDLHPFSSELKKSIAFAFQNVFEISHMDRIYYQSLKDMKFSLRVFRQDRYGVKKFFYKLADTFTSKRCFRFEYVSYHCSLNTKFDFLNFDHHVWRNPTMYSMVSHESFYDLYAKSLKLAKKIIEDSFRYLNHKDIDLKQVFCNLSYVTGLDCNLKKELKYFEF